MIENFFSFRSALSAALAIGVFCGCAEQPSDLPELARVEGMVILDGRPLVGAQVVFAPEIQHGAFSSGFTNEAGHYELAYNAISRGAVLGPQSVRISKVAFDAGPEELPKKFNENSRLTTIVVAGENTINFDLKSK